MVWGEGVVLGASYWREKKHSPCNPQPSCPPATQPYSHPIPPPHKPPPPHLPPAARRCRPVTECCSCLNSSPRAIPPARQGFLQLACQHSLQRAAHCNICP